MITTARNVVGASAIALACLLVGPAASAEQRNNQEPSATKIKRALDANPRAIGLSTAQLRNYSSFKAALSSLVTQTYKPRVRTTDSSFTDAVLKPVYNNLLIHRIKEDKHFSDQANLTSAIVRFGTLPNGEILLYQQVKFTPKRVVSCNDKTRSKNLLCIQGKKRFAELNRAYQKNPDPALEKSVKAFKASYKKNASLAARLNGWNIQRMGTLEAAYAGLAAMPQSRERGSRFLPAAVFAYAKPSDGGGKTSGTEGTPTNTPTPETGPTPGYTTPGNGSPGSGSVRSAAPNQGARFPSFETSKLESTNIALLANQGATTGLLNSSKELAWATRNQGRNTSYELLNGFTNNHRASIGERWNIVCIDYNRWWPGCTQYWFGFELGYGYLYGIRAGFNVNTTATLNNPSTRSGSMSIAMNTGNKNAQVFRGSGLRTQDIFEGKEVLARLCQQNSCFVALLGDLPGPDPLSTRFTRWTLPEVDFLKMLPTCAQVRSRYGAGLQCSALDNLRNGEYTWPNVGSSVNLARWVAPVDLFGGQLNYGVASVEANPYAAINTNGKSYRQTWRIGNGRASRISSQTSTLNFAFTRAGNQSNPIATGVNNEYDFNFSITPGVALKGSAAGYGLGPWYIDIDALAIESPTFTLYRHNGTWNGFWTGVPAR